jgi:hypothetical protein
MGMFSGILDTFAERQFAKDENGRVVFLPRGARRRGYYVDSADENRFKSVVKIYGLAAMLINLTGSTASFAFAQMLALDDHREPLASRLKVALIVYAITAVLLYIGPALIFWKVYRREMDGLCSSLTAADPTSVQLASSPASTQRTAMLFLLAGFLVLALGIFFAVMFRR